MLSKLFVASLSLAANAVGARASGAVHDLAGNELLDSELVATRSLSASNDRPVLDNDTGDTWFRPSPSPQVDGASQWKYPLDTVFGMSMYFYEINRAGRLPADTRVPWRGDTLKLKPGSPASRDGPHEGGYFDAGDHNKFMLPEAYAIGRLAWMGWMEKPTLRSTYFDGEPNVRWSKEAVKWGADFLVRSVVKTSNGGQFLLHIGDIPKDHGYLGRAENYPNIDRNIRYCNVGKCSDVTGEAAAALAHAALAFTQMPEGNNNGRLANRYWGFARVAYRMSGALDAKSPSDFGVSSDEYDLLNVYYKSTGTVSHVFWAAASMMTACRYMERCDAAEEAMYREQAERFGTMKEADGGQKWYWEVPSWDNAWWDGALLMASQGVTGPKNEFVDFPRSFVEKWTKGQSPLSVSPRGQRWISQWGSNRYAASGAAMLLAWADLPANMQGRGSVSPNDAQCAGVKQLHYMLGDNDRGSFVVGFGDNAPERPHHRGSSCSPQEQAEDKINACKKYFDDVKNPVGSCSGGARPDSMGRCEMTANRKNKYTVHGALIGGPKSPSDAGDSNRAAYSEDGWNDWRADWVGSEVTLDYNAHWSMAVAQAMALPADFWLKNCDGAFNSDLGMTTKAGLNRDTGPPPRNAGSFEDFSAYGFERTLPYWQEDLPNMTIPA